MTITLGTVTANASASTLTTTQSVSHTVGSNVRKLAIAAMWEGPASRTVTSVTVGGAAASLVANSRIDVTSGAVQSVVWYEYASPTSGAKTVEITLSDTGSIGLICFDLQSDGSLTLTGNYTASATSTTAVTTPSIGYTSGDALLAAFGGGDGGTTTWTNVTERADFQGASSICSGASLVTSSGSSTTLTATASASQVRLVISALKVVETKITSISPTTIKPGAALTINTTNFASAPTTVTVNSISEAFTGSPSTTQGIMTAIPLTDFAPAGHHVATRWLTNITLTVANGSETASLTVQIDPDVTASEDFTLTSGASDVDDYNPITGAVGGDDFFAFWHTGDNVRDETIVGLADAGSGYMLPTTLPAQGRRMAYDVSGAAWLAAVNTALFESAAADTLDAIVRGIVRGIVKAIVKVIT